MEFTVIGSGGCVCTPKPLCQCGVCTEAREKGYPYKRCGCSLFLEDCSLIVDTPEDIATAINNADIKKVDNILYSHLDPDHTLGMRIMEQLKLEWFDFYDRKFPDRPINIYAQPKVMNDINKIRTKYGSLLDYYASLRLIKRNKVKNSIIISDVKITFISVPYVKAVTVFVFEKCGKKIEENHPIRKELFSVEEILSIADKFNVKSVIITHIEESWGKSYSDYIEIEKQYSNLKFAFDGIKIIL